MRLGRCKMIRKTAKYIIWDNGLNDCVMMFSPHLSHDNIAFQLGVTPISAGFVRFECSPNYVDVIAVPYGESVSLKLTSRPEDSELINSDFGPL
jgi:hypothetical protein